VVEAALGVLGWLVELSFTQIVLVLELVNLRLVELSVGGVEASWRPAVVVEQLVDTSLLVCLVADW